MLPDWVPIANDANTTLLAESALSKAHHLQGHASFVPNHRRRDGTQDMCLFHVAATFGWAAHDEFNGASRVSPIHRVDHGHLLSSAATFREACREPCGHAQRHEPRRRRKR